MYTLGGRGLIHIAPMPFENCAKRCVLKTSLLKTDSHPASVTPPGLGNYSFDMYGNVEKAHDSLETTQRSTLLDTHPHNLDATKTLSEARVNTNVNVAAQRVRVGADFVRRLNERFALSLIDARELYEEVHVDREAALSIHP